MDAEAVERRRRLRAFVETGEERRRRQREIVTGDGPRPRALAPREESALRVSLRRVPWHIGHVGVKVGRLVGLEMPPERSFLDMPAIGMCVGAPEMYARILARGRAMRHV